MEDPRAAEGVRFAVRVASDPSFAVRRWKVLSGRKAVGCTPRFPFPEIMHCVGMLPVLARSAAEIRSLAPLIDAWNPVRLEGPCPPGTEGALDRVEALAEWAEAESGMPCTEGALGKSLRAYLGRDTLTRDLSERCRVIPGFLDSGELRDVLESGRFLPVETHSILLGRILGAVDPAGSAGEAEREDPFLYLARRICAGMGKPGDNGSTERRSAP